MKFPWRDGNRVTLLENGEDFFPRVFAAIEQAGSEVLLETFILFEDKVGQQLREVLIRAARRGLRVEVTVDGWGSPRLSSEFVEGMAEAGVCFRIHDPCWQPLALRYKLFRRIHRKLLVVDRRLAFVGGINFSADHLGDFGPEAKQDYSVELEGPVVADIHGFMEGNLVAPRRTRFRWRPWQHVHLRLPRDRPAGGHGGAGGSRVLFVVRDNGAHRTDIERQYRAAIRAARHELIIANAYFYPGYRLLRDIRNAARRGVDVRLVLQGRPDEPLAMVWARMLYRYLVRDGVRIYEYCRRPFHGKVAVADGSWATVGSSNLDPLSLSLNMEANVVIRDAGFAMHLRERLVSLIADHCTAIGPGQLPAPSLWQTVRGWFVFHSLRRFPAWAGLLPAHTQQVAIVPPPAAGGLANPELVNVAMPTPTAPAQPLQPTSPAA